MKFINKNLSLCMVFLFVCALMGQAKGNEKIVRCGADRLFKELCLLDRRKKGWTGFQP